MAMFVRCFLVCFGLCNAAILHSKDLQTKISDEFFTLQDLAKTGLVDKSWISVGKIFERITPEAGLFEHKNTKEIFFQTIENLWNPRQIAAEFTRATFGQIKWQKLIEEKKWDELFFDLTGYYASAKGYVDFQFGIICQKFLEALAEIIDIDAIDSKDHFYEHLSPLHVAAKSGEVKLMEILLKRGAKIDKIDNEMKTPLMRAIACWQEHQKCGAVRVLLSHGANPRVKSKLDRKPITAVRYSSIAHPCKNCQWLLLAAVFGNIGKAN